MSENTIFGEEQTLAQKLVKKGGLMYFFTIAVAPIFYIIKVLISHELSVEDIGIIYSVISLIILLSNYNDLGLTETIMYYLPKYSIKKDFDKSKTIIIFVLMSQFVTGILIGGGLFLLANRLSINYFHTPAAADVIRIFSIYFLLVNIMQVLSAVYIAFQDVYNNQMIEATRGLSIFIFTIILLFTDSLNFVNYSWTRILGVFSAVVFSSILFIRKYYKFISPGKLDLNKNDISKRFKYSIFIYLSANAAMALGQIDQQMVIYLLGPTQAGIYSNFITLTNIYSIIGTPILRLIFPITVELMTKEHTGKFIELQNVSYKVFTLISLSMGAMILLFGRELGIIFFGMKFAESGVLFGHTGAFMIFYVLTLLNFGILAGLGKVKERLKVTTLSLIGVLVGTPILIKFFGLAGAAFGLILSWIYMSMFAQVIIHKHQKVFWDWKFLLKNVLFIILFIGSIYIFKNDIITDPGLRITNAIKIGMIGIIYYIYLGIINIREVSIIKNEVFKMIKKK